jgi:hypothetical protein
MEKQKQKRLEAAGCGVETPEEFLNLSRRVAQCVARELGLSGRMRDQRDERN